MNFTVNSNLDLFIFHNEIMKFLKTIPENLTTKTRFGVFIYNLICHLLSLYKNIMMKQNFYCNY